MGAAGYTSMTQDKMFLKKFNHLLSGVVLLSLIWLIVLIFINPNPIHHDCAYFLQAGFMLSKGMTPYIDYIGMNPPLIDYLHLLPVFLHQLFNISLVLSFKILISCFMLIMFAILWQTLRNASFVSFNTTKYMLMLGYLITTFLILKVNNFVNNFGQREHLFILSFIPYLFLRYTRIEGHSLPSWISSIAGFFCGLIFLLKPHFLLIVFITEAWLIIRFRKLSHLWKPEIFSLIGLGILYGLYLLFFMPSAMQNAFFKRWLPFFVQHYDVYNVNGWSLILPFAVLPTIFILLTILILYIYVKKYIPKNTIYTEVWILSVGMAHAMMVIQQKGWAYHRYPFIALLNFAILILVLLLFEKWYKSKSRIQMIVSRLTILGIFCYLIFKIIQYSIGSFSQQYPWMPDYVKLIQKYSDKNERIVVLSTSMTPAYPTLVYAERLPGTRYVTSFPMAMFYEGVTQLPDGSFPYRQEKTWTPEERQFLLELGTDIKKFKPKLVFVHASEHNQGTPWGFIIDDYIRQIGWLDEYFKEYQFLQMIDNFKVYIRQNPL
ncbi:hypothetical protein JW824_14480 [bacterium]|nr:hypothetical protein [bacterium]